MIADLGRHSAYILASYAAAAMLLGLLVGQTLLTYRRAKARLAASGEDDV